MVKKYYIYKAGTEFVLYRKFNFKDDAENYVNKNICNGPFTIVEVCEEDTSNTELINCPDCGATLKITSKMKLPDDLELKFIKHN